ADLGPRQSGDQANLVLLLGATEVEATYAEVVVEVLCGDVDRAARLARLLPVRRRLALGQRQLLHHLARDLGDLALEVAHPGFAGVVADHVANRRIADLQFAFLESIRLQLLWNQVADGDV